MAAFYMTNGVKSIIDLYKKALKTPLHAHNFLKKK